MPIDLPTSQESPMIEPFFGSDKRDFSQNKNPYDSTLPMMADDKSRIPNLIKQMQQFAKQFGYNGPINGTKSSELVQALLKFQESSKLSKPVVVGDKISISGFQAATAQNTIKSFQQFFSQNQPVIGKLYSGPIDGISNPELIAAATKTEDAISNATKDNAKGMLWNGKFNTSTQDLANALALIGNKK